MQDNVESILEKGAADYISFARPLIADPDLANKLRAGDGECVRRCVGCNHCIGVRVWNNNRYHGHGSGYQALQSSGDSGH